MKIFLIGYRCTGKTTIGRMMAGRLNIPFADTDAIVQEKQNMTIQTIVEIYGWDKFRQLEQDALKDTLKNRDAVISTGGGIVLSAENRRLIRANGPCIWLTAPEEIIIRRLNVDAATDALRPPLSDLDLLEETRCMIRERDPLYNQTHHIKIDTGTDTPDECVEKICRRLKNVRF